MLLCRAAEVGRPLKARGLQVKSFKSTSSVLKPKEGQEARAIVLGEDAFKESEADELVAQVRKAWPLVDVIVWCSRASARFVRSVLMAGARDVLLTRSVDTVAKSIAEVVEAQQLLPKAARLGPDSGSGARFQGMVSRSRRMWDLFDLVSNIAQTEATVLILGGTGTGKELFARAIHRLSERPGRFVAVNCAAVPEGVIDSELFGHVEGAFTGASRDKDGLFRHAEGGTILLDEIGNVPLAVQYRLLRTLQEATVRPVGGHREVEVDARVIAATSTDLESDVQRGRFREDLFYRLDVIRMEIPPLRERPEDIIYLYGHFARTFAEQYQVERPEVSDEFLDALVEYTWPGNVRQLENFTERLLLTRPTRRVTAAQLKKLLPFKKRTPLRSEARGVKVTLDRPLEEVVAEQSRAIERAYLAACLEKTQGRIQRAAEVAGVSRRTLLRKLKQHGIDKKDFKSQATSS